MEVSGDGLLEALLKRGEAAGRRGELLALVARRADRHLSQAAVKRLVSIRLPGSGGVVEGPAQIPKRFEVESATKVNPRGSAVCECPQTALQAPLDKAG